MKSLTPYLVEHIVAYMIPYVGGANEEELQALLDAIDIFGIKRKKVRVKRLNIDFTQGSSGSFYYQNIVKLNTYLYEAIILDAGDEVMENEDMWIGALKSTRASSLLIHEAFTKFYPLKVIEEFDLEGIESLSLTVSNIDNVVLMKLCEKLKENHTVKHLTLNGTWINVLGVYHSVLPIAHRLETLNLSNNNLFPLTPAIGNMTANYFEMIKRFFEAVVCTMNLSTTLYRCELEDIISQPLSEEQENTIKMIISKLETGKEIWREFDDY